MVFLYTMQYCILRVLRSNFVRVQEQLKSADDVGLIYFPLKYPTGVDKGGEGEEGNPSDLVVFQLLRSIMECISGGLNVLSILYITSTTYIQYNTIYIQYNTIYMHL